MPGAGKSSVGRKLASRLALPFLDSDAEVENAAGMSIDQIFERLGEPAFRDGEAKVIARLLEGPACVLATGGGAFMNERTRALTRQHAISIWLKAEIGILLERTSRRDDRPLLKHGDPARILQDLLSAREIYFSTADIVVTSDARPLENMVDRVMKALNAHMVEATAATQG